MIFQSLLKILLLCSFFVTATIRTETVSDSRNFSGELVVLGDNDTSTSNETADIAITTPYERVLNGTSGRAEESTAESKTFTKTGEKSNDTEGSTTESIFVPITKYSAISLTSQTPEANPEPCITKRRITVTSVSGVTKKTGLEKKNLIIIISVSCSLGLIIFVVIIVVVCCRRKSSGKESKQTGRQESVDEMGLNQKSVGKSNVDREMSELESAHSISCRDSSQFKPWSDITESQFAQQVDVESVKKRKEVSAKEIRHPKILPPSYRRSTAKSLGKSLGPKKAEKSSTVSSSTKSSEPSSQKSDKGLKSKSSSSTSFPKRKI